MGKIAIVTDSNSGITQKQAEELGIYVIPMPFYIDGELYLEDITLTQEEFYHKLEHDAEISTSMPALGDVMDLWNKLLKEYDEIVHIPMSSGLSGSYATAATLAEDFDGKVQVVNNQRISVTQRQSALDAQKLAEQGWDAKKIKEYLEATKFDSTIYITLETLKYLKKGGRITPAAAALGSLLKLKPVLQIQGEKLDAYAKCRTLKAAKATMLDAIATDLKERFHKEDKPEDTWIAIAYTKDIEAANLWKEEVQKAYPNNEIVMCPLSLSVSCHIGPGAIAVTCTKKLPENM
ncbi:MAG: DegV family protein [Lachnospiraceae bacterium]|nr:DegV family protein [Lachnospiraceae bacterium]